MTAVMADEQSTVDAVHSFVADATLPAFCGKKANREDACNTHPGSDQKHLRGVPG